MKDSKNVVIGLLCTVLCVMAVAYAAFSTSLEINGTATIDSTWNVAITDITCTPETSESGGIPVGDASVTGVNTLLAEIGVKFNQPGDSMSCVVTITNKGTLEAKLASIVTTPATVTNGDGQLTGDEEALTIDDFIHFTMGKTGDTAIKNAVLAKTNGTHTYTIYAEYVEVNDASGNPVALPEGSTTRDVTVQFNYVQNLAA